jgi:hypothetical protein
VLTRLYTLDQFGYLSVYTAVPTIFGVIAMLGFELAIPIAASPAPVHRQHLAHAGLHRRGRAIGAARSGQVQAALPTGRPAAVAARGSLDRGGKSDGRLGIPAPSNGTPVSRICTL